MPSFRTVNYALRPHKNIERKLIAELLLGLSRRFDIADYRYIGLGSMWFSDFIILHRLTGIKDMISIEGAAGYGDRARFNAPFRVKVIDGDSTYVLEKVLRLPERRSIIWLDYDSGLEGAFFRDAELLCSELPSGSIVLFTLNTHPDRLRASDATGELREGEAALRELAGDLVPIHLPPEALSWNGFARLAAEIGFQHLARMGRRAAREEQFHPLLHFRYNDGAPMITIGGMIAHPQDSAELEACELQNRFDFVTGEEPFKISVPNLTLKEKAVIDQYLPADEPITSAVLAEVLGFRLPEAEVRGYERFYRQYPLFGEFSG